MSERNYTELSRFGTFEERYRYLKLNGIVSEETFGSRRYLNQVLYRSPLWRRIRRDVILRDDGCDLGLYGYDIFGKLIIHHMNPITIDDILEEKDWVYEPEFLICVSMDTHNAIHYGDESKLTLPIVERKPGDTCPWKLN